MIAFGSKGIYFALAVLTLRLTLAPSFSFRSNSVMQGGIFIQLSILLDWMVTLVIGGQPNSESALPGLCQPQKDTGTTTSCISS